MDAAIRYGVGRHAGQRTLTPSTLASPHPTYVRSAAPISHGPLARAGETTLVDTDDAWLANAAASALLTLGRRTRVRGAIALEHAIAKSRTTLRMAESINEAGTLRYGSVEIDDGALSELRTAQVAIVHRVSAHATVGAGVAGAEDGDGTRDAIAGIRTAVRF